MKFLTALPVLAALALTSSAALAGDAPAPAAPGMGEHHAKMCNNHYAKAVGMLAALEVRLNLTSAQKAPFARWKEVKLADVKVMADKCADMVPLGRDGSIMDHRKHQIARLEARLASLKAETPALEALVKVLDADQQKILKRAAMEAFRGGMDQMHDRRGMDRGMGGGMGGGEHGGHGQMHGQ